MTCFRQSSESPDLSENMGHITIDIDLVQQGPICGRSFCSVRCRRDYPNVFKYFCSVVRNVVRRRWRDIGEHLFAKGYVGMSLDLGDPLPCRMTRASSFAAVECQPTLSPGLSFTEPPLIPLVWGIPLSNGQSPPAQSRVNVIGSRFTASCASMAPKARATQVKVNTSLAFLIKFSDKFLRTMGGRMTVVERLGFGFLQLSTKNSSLEKITPETESCCELHRKARPTRLPRTAQPLPWTMRSVAIPWAARYQSRVAPFLSNSLDSQNSPGRWDHERSPLPNLA